MAEVEVQYHILIPTRDGLQLSANLWLPKAAGERVPAILEMIPYRKDDWRLPSDMQRGHYFAQRGFAFCRLDIRGTGSSPGIALDEYTPQETRDGYDAVEWLAAQPWCNGKVGMWGISYGGFTSIQVAMLRPPSLKAIAPMYATDDRYTDDVHYLGGCVTASELAQYALGMVAMNALPPDSAYVEGWAERWKERLEQTPPWLIGWLQRQTDGAYWRNGSLAPDYERIECAIFSIGGWADSYVDAALRMQQRCTAPRKTLVGPWIHSTPDSAYPAPNVDYLHELTRFFGYWLNDEPNGVMDEPGLIFFRQEYAPPEPFPAQANGAWLAVESFPAPGTQPQEWLLGAGSLSPDPLDSTGVDSYLYRPTLGTRASLCYGAGVAPNGLARDLRPDEALSLTYTSPPLDAPLDLLGKPEALLYLSSTAPVAHIVVRLCDVAPDGTSAHVCTGVLNLTHRESHSDPQPLTPGEVYAVRIPLRGIGYRFRAGQRIRLSVAGGWWPAIFPSPYPAEHALHRGPNYPSRLILPVVPEGVLREAPELKATSPALIALPIGSEQPAVWQIVEDVLAGSVAVKTYGGDTTPLPNGRELTTSERIELTAYHDDPAHALLYNEAIYSLRARGYDITVRSTGSIRSTQRDFHVDVQLDVMLNGNHFFQKSWLETIPRQLV